MPGQYSSTKTYGKYMRTISLLMDAYSALPKDSPQAKNIKYFIMRARLVCPITNEFINLENVKKLSCGHFISQRGFKLFSSKYQDKTTVCPICGKILTDS